MKWSWKITRLAGKNSESQSISPRLIQRFPGSQYCDVRGDSNKHSALGVVQQYQMVIECYTRHESQRSG